MLRRVYKLIDGAIGTGAGASLENSFEDSTSLQATVDGTGAVGATVTIEVSNDDIHWDTLATIILSGTDSDSDSVTVDCMFAFVRGNVTAISGTGANVNLLMSTAHFKEA